MRFLKRLLIARLVDGEQYLSFFHQLVIMNIHLGNESRNVRRDRNDVSAKARVTRPGGFGVIDPGIKNCDEGQND
ncbi:Uncharacterised protein [Shigella flexneri]|nr:Uncharacterised protein [Shigella flexneri]